MDAPRMNWFSYFVVTLTIGVVGSLIAAYIYDARGADRGWAAPAPDETRGRTPAGPNQKGGGPLARSGDGAEGNTDVAPGVAQSEATTGTPAGVRDVSTTPPSELAGEGSKVAAEAPKETPAEPKGSGSSDEPTAQQESPPAFAWRPSRPAQIADTKEKQRWRDALGSGREFSVPSASGGESQALVFELGAFHASGPSDEYWAKGSMTLGVDSKRTWQASARVVGDSMLLSTTGPCLTPGVDGTTAPLRCEFQLAERGRMDFLRMGVGGGLFPRWFETTGHQYVEWQ